jgi:Na+-transporting NADH:ubiquinone oxidoreductase subunit F
MVELIVRLVPGGVGSTYLHNLEVGDRVTFTGPFGDFRLSEEPDAAILCVGGGCGMAPIKSIIYSVLHRWPDRECWLFFGCRAARDIFYLGRFEELAEQHPGFHVIYALSDMEPEDEWDGETGFIHLSVDKHLEPDRRSQAFLCGPPPMIEAVTDVLQEKNLKPSDWYYDEF